MSNSSPNLAQTIEEVLEIINSYQKYLLTGNITTSPFSQDQDGGQSRLILALHRMILQCKKDYETGNTISIAVAEDYLLAALGGLTLSVEDSSQKV